MARDGEFDVFLSYHWQDRAAVEALARRLRARDIEPFLDRWYLVGGQPWQPALERLLTRCRAVAVLVGPQGLGRWQHREAQLALDRQAREPSLTVIPILLPGADAALGFLSLNTWIDLRDGTTEDQLDILALAIEGKPPTPDLKDRI